MKVTPLRVVAVAVAAGALGVLASLWYGGSPLLRSEPGQRALQAVMEADAPAPPPGVTVAGRGDPMPSIALPDLDGNIVDLAANYRGRPLLINVWASWCGPCIEEMPELDRFAKSQPADGVQVIGLALDTPDAVRDFLGRIPVAYPIVLDTPGPADASVWLGNRKGVLPYTVLIGADGRIAKQKIGPFRHGEISGWAGE
ncbi:TlpA family protein disulfide reductase [Pseudoxanthomonas wuyuanensis]|uniref:Thiol-disulfide isomerase or thioredoxin n=1 Tax=Pseudoxanthomonas wuyuanensis TaxID=1073196 RepID=A0A286D2C1_9GAMM|nr:TlpA disulfide reductase family protein [Pseudoxanthomonas wuyuanensis]KAF1723156.1 TlpA family protein disulfide reductase [Pseudoxanthomonas wuyuanensis]SOD52756.1 Thiol-disulfide isomerase or thioredoxin [Pseudoxanthomonas wuyuanensis]